MHSAIILASFTFIGAALLYTIMTSSYQNQLNLSLIIQKQLYKDSERLVEVAKGTYLKGWTTSVIEVRFNEVYSFNLGQNFISMSKNEEEITQTLPLNIIPAKFNASSVNVSYTVYNGTPAINISPS